MEPMVEREGREREYLLDIAGMGRGWDQKEQEVDCLRIAVLEMKSVVEIESWN